MSITAWSTTASQNGNRLVSGNYLENQAPSTVNDAGRSVMAQIRSWANNLEWFEFGTGANTVSYTRISATQITMAVNVVDQFHVNRRVRIVDGTGATLYGRVTSSAFNSPNTALTFEFDSSSLGSGNPTSVSYGIVSATNTSLPSVVPTGTILMTGGASADSGYLFCDGTAYSKTGYSALFTKIGTAFGSSSTTFNVPNLQQRFPMGKGSSDNIGDTGGSFTQTPSGSISAPSFSGNAFTPSGSVSISGSTGSHSLTLAEIPEHYHYVVHNDYFTTNSVNNWTTAQKEFAMARGSAGGMGSSDTHNQTVNTSSLLADGGRSSIVGSGSGHNHSLSATGSFSGSAQAVSGTVSAPNFTGSVMDLKNPYVALNYQIKY